MLAGCAPTWALFGGVLLGVLSEVLSGVVSGVFAELSSGYASEPEGCCSAGVLIVPVVLARLCCGVDTDCHILVGEKKFFPISAPYRLLVSAPLRVAYGTISVCCRTIFVRSLHDLRALSLCIARYVSQSYTQLKGNSAQLHILRTLLTKATDAQLIKGVPLPNPSA